MSLKIDVGSVTGVMLSDGSVHTVAQGSFNLDSYEFVDDGELIHGGGKSGITPTGFVFKNASGVVIAGPLTAIIAVMRKP